MTIFGQPTVADFVEAKLPFDNAELMFQTCANARFVPIFGALLSGQLSIPAAFGLSGVLSAGRVIVCFGGHRRSRPKPAFLRCEASQAIPGNRARWPRSPPPSEMSRVLLSPEICAFMPKS